ncbi:MAG: excinuclease ABC subunit UvrC [Acidimicrobiales bacterium]|mgnify:CR=1 FL=1|jgi:excinuclease ABC subunit C|nr:excinuclease ABC subunit UvrC [Acidimicrobiales bacterium]MDP6901928.1 excinuclease ABC subunit UvrC [Acidimicrobiales bacterium]HJL99263.1 excinuclease ABC subunit UvrC [Acidimicrobiales bacterium]
MSLRPESGSVPDQPGSYQFKDQAGRIIYVGKAKSLRSRLNSYFQDARNLHPRTVQMLSTATSIEWVEVATEVDALMLEYSLIQRHQPRFNVRLRDDKSYPFLAVTLRDEWPRAMVMRGKRKRGNRYFGPFGHAYAIRETLDLLLRTFPIRTCSDNKMSEHQRLGRPCLLFHIEQCAGPCVGEISPQAYEELVNDLIRFLEGDTDEVLRDLNNRMQSASNSREFELAARYRDRLTSVKKAIEKQQIAGTRNEDFDVIGVHDDELEASVQVFFVRKGRVMGQRGSIVDKVEDVTQPDLIARIVEDIYHDDNPIGMPKNVFVPTLPQRKSLYEEWLTQQRGSRVEIRIPQRGHKRALHETATKNARESFTRHRLKRGTDHNSRAKALEELQRYLELPNAPLRIECYDMSHLQGTDYVGSMVVLEDALPRKSEYRRFKIRDVEGNDDFAAMEEVLSRRFQNYLDERESPSTEATKFAYPPQLLVVDGGKGQLGVAVRVLESMGLREEIPVVALAKQFEEVFIPGRGAAIEVPRGSEALYLLQRIRDESHRFAIAYHRQLRNKRMTRSVLDGIAGLGEARRKRLIREFGGVRKVQRATLEDLLALSWLPDGVAVAVHERTQGRA